MRGIGKIFLAGAGSLLALSAAQAAEQAPQAAGNEGDVSADIIVTAQRRSESLMRTPVSVSVVDAKALASRNIASEADLQVAVPGLIVRAGQNSNELNFAIRGESLDPFSKTRPGVLPYFNEIQVTNAGGSSAFYDLQSVQVLKGPQGTLFGRNSTGGAVLFTTSKPTNEVEGYLAGRLGNYNLREFEGAVNVPIVDDKVMVRVAAVSQFRDGYQKNFDGRRFGTVKRNGGRFSATVRPFDGIENTVVFDYLKTGGSPLSGVLYSLTPSGIVPIIALSAGKLPQYADITQFFAAQQARGPYRTEIDSRTEFHGKSIILSNITSAEIAPGMKLRNIFGYTHLNQRYYNDLDGSPYQIDDFNDFGRANRVTQYSNEFQLVGDKLFGALDYVTGVYWAKESYFDFTPSRLLGFNAPGFIQYNTTTTGSRTWAFYGQGTMDLGGVTGLDGLSAIVGARYSSERTSVHVPLGDNSRLDPPAQQALYDFDQSHTYKNLSWTLGLQYQASPALMLYTASRHGYRNGGYNTYVKPIPGVGEDGGNRYRAQEVTDAEIGAKYNGRLMGMPTRTSVALYTIWSKKTQRAASTLISGAPGTVTVNVPRSRIRGFEVEGSINPTEWLTLGGSLNYTDAVNTSNLVRIAGAAPVAFDTYPDAPKWSGTAFANISVPLSPDMTGSLRGDMFGQTGTWFNGQGGTVNGTHLPGYKLFNLRAGLDMDERGLSFSVNVKNVFNKTYWAGGQSLGALFQINTAVPGSRRTISAEARVKF